MHFSHNISTPQPQPELLINNAVPPGPGDKAWLADRHPLGAGSRPSTKRHQPLEIGRARRSRGRQPPRRPYHRPFSPMPHRSRETAPPVAVPPARQPRPGRLRVVQSRGRERRPIVANVIAPRPAPLRRRLRVCHLPRGAPSYLTSRPLMTRTARGGAGVRALLRSPAPVASCFVVRPWTSGISGRSLDTLAVRQLVAAAERRGSQCRWIGVKASGLSR